MKLLALTALAALAALAAAAPAVAQAPAASDTAFAHTHGPDPKSIDKRGRFAPASYLVDAWAQPRPDLLDGRSLTDDAPDVQGLAGKPQVHLVYLHPSDRGSRFGQFASMFAGDAAQAEALLQGLYGRTVRFDYRADENNNGRYLDITVIKSKNNYKRLSGGQQFSLVDQEIKSKFTDSNKKYAVWLDADSNYCGQATLYQDTRRTSANYNQLRSTAIVYRPYDRDVQSPDTGGFCRGRTLLHEIGHNLGALQKTAPNAFDGAHCDDDGEDVMCYEQQTVSASKTPQFDSGNDDYWDPTDTLAGGPALPWWTVNLSKFVCPRTGSTTGSPPANCTA